MNFVKDGDAFRHHLKIIDSLFLRDSRLPDKVLGGGLTCGGFFEDTVRSGSFFERIKAFVAKTGENKFHLAVTVPAPEEYFYREAGSYPVIEVPLVETRDEYVAFLQGEYKGDQLVGTMLYHAQVTLIYSDSTSWGIHIDNHDLEIGVAGFADTDLKSAWVSAYGANHVFTAAEAIEVVVENVFANVPSGVPNDIREQLIKNYPPEKFGSLF